MLGRASPDGGMKTHTNGTPTASVATVLPAGGATCTQKALVATVHAHNMSLVVDKKGGMCCVGRAATRSELAAADSVARDKGWGSFLPAPVQWGWLRCCDAVFLAPGDLCCELHACLATKLVHCDVGWETLAPCSP